MTQPANAATDEMFAALCREVGFCLHPKGERRVLEALPNGLAAAVRAVFDAEGVDSPRRRATFAAPSAIV